VWLQDSDGGAMRVFRVPRKDAMKPIGSGVMPFRKTMRHHAADLRFRIYVEGSIAVALAVRQNCCEQSKSHPVFIAALIEV
jgi:hypothetical protein